MNIFWVLWFVPCALANRIRGGWFALQIKEIFSFWATTPARLFVSAVISTPVFFTQTLRVSSLFYILLYIGYIFGWSPWQYMMNPLKYTLILTVRGLLLTVPAGFVCDLYWYAASGSLMGLVYCFSYKLHLKYKQVDSYEWICPDWGELLFWGILGLFIGINISLL